MGAGALLALGLGAGGAADQPRRRWAPIDPDAELVVALADDTNNMDPRIGMGSIRSNYIRQVFESLVDVDAAGQARARPGALLEARWASSRGSSPCARACASTTASRSTPTPCSSTSTASSGRTSTSGASRTSPPAPRSRRTYPWVTRWEKVDDYTVRIHTSEPAPKLWDYIGREPLVPKAYTIKNGVEALNERPVGTGPWRMVEWKRKDSMRFERCDGYWGPPPRLKRLRFQADPRGARRASPRCAPGRWR